MTFTPFFLNTPHLKKIANNINIVIANLFVCSRLLLSSITLIAVKLILLPE